MHDFAWVVEELKAGRKARRAEWFKDYYIFKAVNGGITLAQRTSYNEWRARAHDIFANDWEGKN